MTYYTLQSKTILKHLLHYWFIFLVGTALTALEAHSCTEWLVTISILLTGHSATSFPTILVTYCMSGSITCILFFFDKLLQPFRLVSYPKIVWLAHFGIKIEIIGLYSAGASRALDPGTKSWQFMTMNNSWQKEFCCL